MTIGNSCSIHSCIIDDDVVLGSGSIVMEGCVLERGCEIAPMSVIPPGRLIPAGQLWAGNPARFVRHLSEEELLSNYSKSYTSGVVDEENNEALWPGNYVSEEMKRGEGQEETIQEYMEKHFFG